MNIVSKKVSAMIFSAVIMSSVHGMEQDNMTEITTGQPIPSAWYKNSSVQVAAAVTTVVLVSYAVAVRMGKVPALALPAVVAGFFAVQRGSTVQALTPESGFGNDNSQQTQTSVEQNQEITQQTSEVPVQNDVLSDVKKAVIDFRNSVKGLTWDDYKRTLEGMTEEDFKRMNEDSVR